MRLCTALQPPALAPIGWSAQHLSRGDFFPDTGGFVRAHLLHLPNLRHTRVGTAPGPGGGLCKGEALAQAAVGNRLGATNSPWWRQSRWYEREARVFPGSPRTRT